MKLDIAKFTKSKKVNGNLGNVLSFVRDNLVPVEIPDEPRPSTPDITPTACTSFDQLCESFSKHIEWAPIHRDSLATCLAVAFSVNVPGELLWMFVVGPASSGKTLMTSAISANPEHFYSLSKLTGLHSGFRGTAQRTKDGESENDEDESQSASPIEKMNQKCVVFPDFTTLLSMSPNTFMQLLGELRDVYEGKYNVMYKNKVQDTNSNVNFSILAAVTDDIHRVNVSDVGERFLKIDVSSEELRSSRFVQAAIQEDTETLLAAFRGDKPDDRRPWEAPLKSLAWGYYDHLLVVYKNHSFVPEFSQSARDRIIAMGQFVSEIRAKVSRTRNNEVNYRPRAEHPTRLAKLFQKLALCIAFVTQQSVNEDVMRIVLKIANDTAYGYALDICRQLYEYQIRPQSMGLTKAQLQSILAMSESTCLRYLRDLEDLGVVEHEKRSNNSGVSGRRSHYYQLSQRVFQCYHFAKTGEIIQDTRQRKQATKKSGPIRIEL